MPNLLPYIPDSELLPAEYAIDPYSPIGDKYFQRLDLIQKQLLVATHDLDKTWYVGAVKLHMGGKPTKEIAKTVGKGVERIRLVLNSEEAQRFMALTRLLSMVRDGPLEMQRKDMLWRISVDNELLQPRISIQAITEINRMEGTYESEIGKGSLTVVVNNNVLVAGPLDK